MKEIKEYAQDSSYIEYLVDRIDELSLKRRVVHELYTYHSLEEKLDEHISDWKWV